MRHLKLSKVQEHPLDVMQAQCALTTCCHAALVKIKKELQGIEKDVSTSGRTVCKKRM